MSYMPDTPTTAAYAIDADDRIVWTDLGFSRLAVEHGQRQLADGALIGRPLSDFVAGERPRALQEALIERARAMNRPLELRYRCDAPEIRRHAILRLEAQEDGGVVFTTWFESIEGRPYQPLLDYNRPRAGDDVVQLCAWCNRVDLGGWREADDDMATRLASATAEPPRVEHTVCEICELLLPTRPAGGPTRSGPSGPA